MKKYLVVLLGVLCLFGCGKADQSNVKDEFVKNISKKNSYLVKDDCVSKKRGYGFV